MTRLSNTQVAVKLECNVLVLVSEVPSDEVPSAVSTETIGPGSVYAVDNPLELNITIVDVLIECINPELNLLTRTLVPNHQSTVTEVILEVGHVTYPMILK